MTGPLSEAQLLEAYGERRPTSQELREACARVARWTYVPSQPSKMLDLARDIAELREALALEIAADQVEAFPFYPSLPDPSVELLSKVGEALAAMLRAVEALEEARDAVRVVTAYERALPLLERVSRRLENAAAQAELDRRLVEDLVHGDHDAGRP